MDKTTKVEVPISNNGKPFEITITRSIQRKDIADLLVGAIEGGSNYWIGEFKVKKPTRRDFIYEESKVSLYEAPLNPGGQFIIKADDETRTRILDETAIESGLKLMAEKHPTHMNDFLSENSDAITSDVFLQLCLFGDVIYG